MLCLSVCDCFLFCSSFFSLVLFVSFVYYIRFRKKFIWIIRGRSNICPFAALSQKDFDVMIFTFKWTWNTQNLVKCSSSLSRAAYYLLNSALLRNATIFAILFFAIWLTFFAGMCFSTLFFVRCFKETPTKRKKKTGKHENGFRHITHSHNKIQIIHKILSILQFNFSLKADLCCS